MARGKFRVGAVQGNEVVMQQIADNQISDADRLYANTPQGTVQLTIDNPRLLGWFKDRQSKNVYIDITEAT